MLGTNTVSEVWSNVRGYTDVLPIFLNILFLKLSLVMWSVLVMPTDDDNDKCNE